MSRGGSVGSIGVPSGDSWPPLELIGSPLGFLEMSLGLFQGQTFDYRTLFAASWRFPGTHGSPVCGLLETSWVHWILLVSDLLGGPWVFAGVGLLTTGPFLVHRGGSL